MSTLSGFKRFKDHVKTSTGEYQLVSKWTTANSVIMGDGSDETDNVENRLEKLKVQNVEITLTNMVENNYTRLIIHGSLACLNLSCRTTNDCGVIGGGNEVCICNINPSYAPKNSIFNSAVIVYGSNNLYNGFIRIDSQGNVWFVAQSDVPARAFIRTSIVWTIGN